VEAIKVVEQERDEHRRERARPFRPLAFVGCMPHMHAPIFLLVTELYGLTAEEIKIVEGS